MKTEIPVVRQISWGMVLLHFVVIAVCGVLAVILLWDRLHFLSISVGMAVYLAYSFGSRALLMRDHQRGMRLIQRGDYEGAIGAFQSSYDFFTRHAWIDRSRSLTLMLSAKQSIREMALINIAAAYGYLGAKTQMKAYYERALHEFPHSSMAQSALRFIATMESES